MTSDQLRSPVRLSEQPGAVDADFTRVDQWAEDLASRSKDRTYYQGDYVSEVADALSGDTEGLSDLSDAEKTRLLDHAHERLYNPRIDGHNRGVGYIQSLARQVDDQDAAFISDDLAQRAMTLTDRERLSRGSPNIVPADSHAVRRQASAYATSAFLTNPENPTGFIERLGADAPRFADALQLDRPHDVPGIPNVEVAGHLYEAADGVRDPALRDSFKAAIERGAAGRPTDPVLAEAWDRLSTTDPRSLSQADLQFGNELLQDYPPGSRGARVLGEDHPAVQSADRLAESAPILYERLQEENAVYRRAGFDDDVPYAAGSVEDNAAFLDDVRSRVDTLSPRAADQALQALDAQKAAGVDVEGGAELRQQFERRLMISAGQDLAARLDYQMDNAVEEQGWIGQQWDNVRNFFGHESGSQAVQRHLGEMEEAKTALSDLQDFEGSNEALQLEFATRLDALREQAETTSEAISGYIEQQDGLSTRALGFVQAVGGGLEVAAGAGMIAAPEPGTSVVGVGVVVVGADDVQAGVRKLVSGEDVPTFRAQVAEDTARRLGASDGTAAVVGTVADLAPAGVSLARGLYKQSHRFFAGSRAVDVATDTRVLDSFTDAMARQRPRLALRAVRGRAFRGALADEQMQALRAQGITIRTNADQALDGLTRTGRPGTGPLGGFNQSVVDGEAHKLWVSGRFSGKGELLDVLRADGVPEDLLQRIPVDLFGNRPRR